VSPSSRPEEPVGLADLAGVRQATYALYGALYRGPIAAARLETASAAAAELRQQENRVRCFSFFPGWRSVLDALTGLDAEARASLGEEHVRLFQVGALSSLCPPFEAAYLDPSGFERGIRAVGVERAYARAGVTVSPGELPDHVGLELEFVSLLCAEEAEAWRALDEPRALESLRLQASFLDEHLLRWLPAFVRSVHSAASEGSFFVRLADATRAFVVHDRELARAILARADGTASVR
jgi:TorA maturation chaperone TorD